MPKHWKGRLAFYSTEIKTPRISRNIPALQSTIANQQSACVQFRSNWRSGTMTLTIAQNRRSMHRKQAEQKDLKSAFWQNASPCFSCEQSRTVGYFATLDFWDDTKSLKNGGGFPSKHGTSRIDRLGREICHRIWMRKRQILSERIFRIIENLELFCSWMNEWMNELIN